LIAWLVLSAGRWRAFWMVGLNGFVWLAIWLAVCRTPPEALGAKAEPAPLVLGLLGQRFVWSLTLAKVFSDPVWCWYIFWFPQYLSSTHGFSLVQIGSVAVVSVAMFGYAGCLANTLALPGTSAGGKS
jgi:ACS family hexuronate transporter-like MFS transporter